MQPPTNWAQVLSPLVSALASLLPGIALAGFAVYFRKSNLAAGLGAALKTADVLVTAALAGLGWAIARFLSSINKRFDTTDASLREVKSATDGILREVKNLLEQQRVGR